MTIRRHGFFAAMLRFVAAKPVEDDPRAQAMMEVLRIAAASAEAEGQFTVAAGDLAVAARAFAAVAALLQQRILPEAVAHGHAEAEADIRWSVDAAMEAVTMLLREAAAGNDQAVTVRLPPA